MDTLQIDDTIHKDQAVILFATDLHYLSPSLSDGGGFFIRMVEKADGKLPERSLQILDAWIEEVLNTRPDAAILAGDLTFNGEYQSLLEVADKLKKVQAEGIPMLVIPGNHDINYPYACRYAGDKACRVQNISQADFQEVCAELGYKNAVSACESSFSYVYDIPGFVRILLLDTNTQKAPGGLDPETFVWAGEELGKARKLGIPVITVTHQNVLRQSRLLYHGFVIRNEEEVRNLLLEGGVKANFSGHSHIQHIAAFPAEGKEDQAAYKESETAGFKDYATGCLTVFPLHYAKISIGKDGQTGYTPKELDVCREEAEARFDQCTSRQVGEALAGLELSEKDRKAMLDFAVDVNKRYFSGILEENVRQEAGWKLWAKYGRKTFWYAYFASLL